MGKEMNLTRSCAGSSRPWCWECHTCTSSLYCSSCFQSCCETVPCSVTMKSHLSDCIRHLRCLDSPIRPAVPFHNHCALSLIRPSCLRSPSVCFLYTCFLSLLLLKAVVNLSVSLTHTLSHKRTRCAFFFYMPEVMKRVAFRAASASAKRFSEGNKQKSQAVLSAVFGLLDRSVGFIPY